MTLATVEEESEMEQHEKVDSVAYFECKMAPELEIGWAEVAHIGKGRLVVRSSGDSFGLVMEMGEGDA